MLLVDQANLRPHNEASSQVFTGAMDDVSNQLGYNHVLLGSSSF